MDPFRILFRKAGLIAVLIAGASTLWTPCAFAAISFQTCLETFQKLGDLVLSTPVYKMNELTLSPQIRTVRLSWAPENFSNPAFHDNQHFTYLVHGVRQSRFKDTFSKPSIELALRRGFSADRLGLVDLENNPEKISDKKIISASVISQDHPITFMFSGIILKVPYQNIYASHYEDMGSRHGFSPMILDAQALNLAKYDSKRFGLQTPSEVLQDSSRGKHNEIIILGKTPSGHRVEAAALFIVTNERAPIISGPEVEKYIQAANRLSIPLIYIEKSVPR